MPAGRPFPFLIEPARSWAAIEQRLATTTDQRHRRMLALMITHLRAEIEADLDTMLSTVVADPRYHFWHGGPDTGPKDAAALRAHYTEFIESRSGVFEFEVDRIVVDDHTVFTEGTFFMCYSRELAARTGFDVGDDASAGAGPYLCPIRAVVVWPFDADGGLLGEDVYANFDPTAAVALPDELVPARWLEVSG